MFPFVRGITLVVALSLDCGAALAEDLNSANSVMGGCHSFLAITDKPPVSSTFADGFLAGRCLGIVDALSGTPNVCAPAGVTSGKSLECAYAHN